MIKKMFAGLALALLVHGQVLANSTINPNVPAQNSPMSSAPIRANFAAAYSDINSILGQFSGSSAPANPTRFQLWMDTSTSPATAKIYDGSTWVSYGRINTGTHAWTALGTWNGTAVASAYGGTGQDFSSASGALIYTNGTASVGALPPSVIPTPTPSTLGGVFSKTCSGSQWLNQIDTSGTPNCAQPAASDLSNGTTGTGAVVLAGGGTLSAPTIATIVNVGTLTLPSSTDTLVGRATTDTLVNKSISGSTNTLTNIPLTAFTNLGTTTTVLHGNASGNPTFAAVSLTADVSGTLAVGHGGTGATTITGLVLGNGSSAMSAYPGATCTNQALTALSAAGASTCNSITNSYLTAGTFSSITGTGTLTAGATGAGFTVALGTSTISGTLPAANFPALTGDVTTSAGALATTLATVNSNVGSFGSSTAIPSFTVNAKGLITAASTNAVVAPAGTLSGATLASGVTASSLTSVGTIATGVWQGTKVGLAYGGTNADLSATGGTSQVLKQASAGAAITVGQLAASDLSNGVTGSGLVTLRTAPTFVTSAYVAGLIFLNAANSGTQPVANEAWMRKIGGSGNGFSLNSGGTDGMYLQGDMAADVLLNYAGGNTGIGGYTAGSVGYKLSVNGTVNAVGAYYANGTVGVSCPANTITILTFVVTQGIVTHC